MIVSRSNSMVGKKSNGVGNFSWFAVMVTAFSLGMLHAGFATAQYWPQWRGPLANGVSPDGNPPTSWSETENIKWKVKIPGSGSATPIVWENQVFIQTAIPVASEPDEVAQASDGESAPAATSDGESGEEDSASEPRFRPRPEGGPRRAPPGARGAGPRGEGPRPGGRFGGGPRVGGGFGSQAPTETYQFVLICLDRETGETLWQQIAREEVPHEGHHRDHGFASHSPVTDGEHVFAYFGSRGLHCYDMQGNLQWEKDFGQMRISLGFGEGSSPALHGDTIVINWDHQGDSFIVALDKTTGEERWRQAREEGTTWVTPLIVEYEGQAQVVTTGANRVRSYDLQTGELIWECDGLPANVIPSPVADDGMVYVTSGHRGSLLLAIRLGHTGDLTDTQAIAWSHDRSTPYVPSPLLYDHRLYFFASNNAILSCFDAKTGSALFGPERLSGGIQGVYASPVGAAGRVYLVGRNGVTLVIEHGDELNVLATNSLDDRIDASPAIVGNELFLRGHEYLYCIAEQ